MWGRDTPEKRARLELEVRRRLMATEKKKAKVARVKKARVKAARKKKR